MVLDGRVEEAVREHNRMLSLFTGIFVVANPIPIKYGVNRAGFNVGSPRLPLTEPDERTAAFLDELFSKYAVDLPVGVAS